MDVKKSDESPMNFQRKRNNKNLNTLQLVTSISYTRISRSWIFIRKKKTTGAELIEISQCNC